MSPIASTISWSELADGYGPATNTPALITDLSSTSAAKRKKAREELCDRYVTDEPVSGLPEVVKALVPLALDQATVETHANVRLLVDLVLVDPDRYLREPFGGAKAVETMGELERAAYDAFLALAPALNKALCDADPQLRAVSCLALSFMTEPAATPLAALKQLAANDPIHDVRISALLALARIGRHGSPALRAAVAELGADIGDAPRAVATFLLGDELDGEALDALAAALPAPPHAREDLPWANGDLADVAAGVLRAEGERARAVLPAIVDAVEKERDRAQLRDADLALQLLLPEHAKSRRTLSASDLSDDQRASLERMAKANAHADYRGYGLPETPAQLLRLLGARGGGGAPPIEQEVEIAGKGKRAAWQWFAALFEKQVERAALLEALCARFAPAELLALLRDATRGAFGAPLPPMALVFDAVAYTGDDRAAYLRLADETLALDPVAAPPAALLAALPLVRLGITSDQYDALFTRVFRGNDKAIVAEFEKLLPTDVALRVKPKPKSPR